MKLKVLCFLILSLFSSLTHACPTSYSNYIKNISHYLRDDASGVARITKEFNDCYLSRSSIDDETIWHVEYLRSIAYMTGDKRAIQDAKRIFSTTPALNNNQKKYEKLMDIAFIFRDFDFARAIESKYGSGREIPPSLTKFHSRNILTNKDNGRQWIGFNFPEGGHIIVVGNDSCSFSQSLSTFLQSEEDINHVLNKQITWISPVDLNFEAGRLINDIYNISEWPEIDVWETPSIYFYYDGKLVSKIIGWPNIGKRDEFLANLSKIGIDVLTLPSDSR